MSIYMSRAELEEISEGLITAYANKFSNRVIQSIDIEHFITEFLMLRIEYASFAEDDAGRIGFLADGATPLLVHQDGKIIPFVFPKDTIVLDKFLLAEKEQGRRRFTMAHEASHHILSKMYAMPSEGRFHTEYDSERSYSKEELAQMFASVEWQADTMGASLLIYRKYTDEASHFAITTPKTKSGVRIIPMLSDVKAALTEEYKAQLESGFNTSEVDGYSGFIFKSRYNTVLSPHCVNRAIDRIIKACNTKEEEDAKAEGREPELLPHFSCHHLRHTFCTRFCENETNLKVIQEIMGHADITTTMDIYNEATKDKKIESFAGLEGKIKIR